MQEADGVEVRVMYYVRRRKVTEEPVYLEYPIDIDMDVLTKVARDDIDVEVYVGVVADWASRVVDIEVEQFIADRATYEDALDNSLSEGFDELDNAEEAADAYDYNYYYDQYTAPYADYYDYEPLQVAGVGDVSKPRG